MDAKRLEEQIGKTGYVLENEVAQILKAAGWTVISNKYYVDDFEESVREIDLVAYQVEKVQDIIVYTVLVISCKKSESNVWALLARETNLKDPNVNWWPLHAWSNDKRLAYQLGTPNIGHRYHDEVAALGVKDVLTIPAVEVFAFQEMDGKGGQPQNQKAIFSAITSLMKAQAYELGALPRRKKEPSVYQFNLLSVVDAELAQLMFAGGKVTCAEIDSEQYLARYIIKRDETFSRIRFIRSNVFAKSLEDYGRLHKANAIWFERISNEFYDGIERDSRRREVLRDDLNEALEWELIWYTPFKETTEARLSWQEKNGELVVYLNFDDQAIAKISEDADALRGIAAILAKLLRYKGRFVVKRDPLHKGQTGH